MLSVFVLQTYKLYLNSLEPSTKSFALRIVHRLQSDLCQTMFAYSCSSLHSMRDVLLQCNAAAATAAPQAIEMHPYWQSCKREAAEQHKRM
jgi:hypothetical protein